MPGRIRWLFGGARITPSLTTKMLLAAGLGQVAVAEQNGLRRAGVHRHLAQQQLPSSDDGLDVAAQPAEVVAVTALTPFSTSSFGGVASGSAHHEDGRLASFGKA